ncbi:MAG: hypothetical protein HMLKMBBP_00244 [Planctomycetes bacterium]|nr:hypothetical protein [Planctomycetota bacterium]
MTTATHLPPTDHPLEDGRTRCAWVRGRPELYAFHDAEWGMFPDDETFACERLLLAALSSGGSLADVLPRRDAIWETLEKWDLAKVGALSDAALDDLAKSGAVGDRAALGRARAAAAAGAVVAKDCKGLREYFLAVRFLPPEEQISDVRARFPGFSREDAANLIEMVGGSAGCTHDRDCWRA